MYILLLDFDNLIHLSKSPRITKTYTIYVLTIHMCKLCNVKYSFSSYPILLNFSLSLVSFKKEYISQ